LEVELESLLLDRVSGASEIERRLLATVLSADAVDVAKTLPELPARLRSTFPQMANIEDLCREIESLESKSAGTNGDGAAAAFREVAKRRLDAAMG